MRNDQKDDHRNDQGFTLSEILVSMAVISVGLMALMTLALFGFNEFQYTKNKLEAQAEIVRFQYVLTSFFGQAVKVGIADPNTSGSEGGVRQFNYRTIADAGVDMILIASFIRDVGGRGNLSTQVVGQYHRSAIWWRRPSRNTFGTVIFDGDPGNVSNLRPSHDDQYIGRMTELEFTREATNSRLSAILVRSVFRYYRPSTGVNWCPRLDIVGSSAGCTGVIPNYKDMEKSFRIVLRNNVLRTPSLTGVNSPERPLGLIYFFNPVTPTTWGL